mmetsp:Transcript_10178/g.23800  ORF Transcript_10178/g.23800 Transcript_10178/m.23800 type:complete len:203 (-) Transcript_10178:403-1011(-)
MTALHDRLALLVRQQLLHRRLRLHVASVAPLPHLAVYAGGVRPHDDLCGGDVPLHLAHDCGGDFGDLLFGVVCDDRNLLARTLVVDGCVPRRPLADELGLLQAALEVGLEKARDLDGLPPRDGVICAVDTAANKAERNNRDRVRGGGGGGVAGGEAEYSLRLAAVAPDRPHRLLAQRARRVHALLQDGSVNLHLGHVRQKGA